MSTNISAVPNLTGESLLFENFQVSAYSHAEMWTYSLMFKESDSWPVSTIYQGDTLYHGTDTRYQAITNTTSYVLSLK